MPVRRSERFWVSNIHRSKKWTIVDGVILLWISTAILLYIVRFHNLKNIIRCAQIHRQIYFRRTTDCSTAHGSGCKLWCLQGSHFYQPSDPDSFAHRAERSATLLPTVCVLQTKWAGRERVFWLNYALFERGFCHIVMQNLKDLCQRTYESGQQGWRSGLFGSGQ